MQFHYRIDLDERGSFSAGVFNPAIGQDVYYLHEDDIIDQKEYIGYMKHARDIRGLERYLKYLEVLKPKDTLVMEP